MRPWRGRCFAAVVDLAPFCGAALLVLTGCRENPLSRADAAAAGVDVVAAVETPDAGPATPPEESKARVTAPHSVVVRRVDAAAGARVVRGARIALVAPVEGLASKVALADAERVVAERDLSRFKELRAFGEPMEREIDAALDRRRSARDRAARARASLRQPSERIIQPLPAWKPTRG